MRRRFSYTAVVLAIARCGLAGHPTLSLVLYDKGSAT